MCHLFFQITLWFKWFPKCPVIKNFYQILQIQGYDTSVESGCNCTERKNQHGPTMNLYPGSQVSLSEFGSGVRKERGGNWQSALICILLKQSVLQPSNLAGGATTALLTLKAAKYYLPSSVLGSLVQLCCNTGIKTSKETAQRSEVSLVVS